MMPVVAWFPFWYLRRNIRTSGGRLCRIANSYRYFSRILLVPWLGRQPVLRPLMPSDRAGSTGFYGPFLERPSVGGPSAFPPYSQVLLRGSSGVPRFLAGPPLGQVLELP